MSATLFDPKTIRQQPADNSHSAETLAVDSLAQANQPAGTAKKKVYCHPRLPDERVWLRKNG